jgi:hypothetical protein
MWQKGGVFFSPTIVSIGNNGSWVLVKDSEKNFYLLGPRGDIITRVQASSKIKKVAASSDGQFILALLASGEVQLYKVI